ncbi:MULTISPECIES: peptide-methionine (S)-S-oxide reductase MsrA [Bacillaceae]|uniref:Peptide methionine sulfoxide reductase MsrA n=1 Tax=Domibacillus aminovorans TaxID=29332 RepID=A0A177KS74_9BACI|nr:MULTISPECIES: peptide-methionine (S)-S-oxide reductase MsrA [Bacillaceae]OAH55805.1 methionine sulfoxide reductase A [Domibacillus aminovorans]
MEKAIFAGGCFWCMVKPFDEQPGIQSVISGYTAGHTENPTYEEVCSDTTGHVEAVEITFDPDMFSYEKLLDVYWMQIDPTDGGGQFYDRGRSYMPAIFYTTDQQKVLAEKSKQSLDASGRFNRPIAVQILPAERFFEAEEYHQQYYRKNRLHYEAYQARSGRAGFIQSNWGAIK